MLGLGLFLLGLVMGGAGAAYISTKKCTDGCEADLGICKMGRETRQQELETTTQELNQCRQQIKRMR